MLFKSISSRLQVDFKSTRATPSPVEVDLDFGKSLTSLGKTNRDSETLAVKLKRLLQCSPLKRPTDKWPFQFNGHYFEVPI